MKRTLLHSLMRFRASQHEEESHPSNVPQSAPPFPLLPPPFLLFLLILLLRPPSSDALEGQPPFSAIHVGAAAETLPQELLDALAPGGRMVIPVGPQWTGQVGGGRGEGQGMDGRGGWGWKCWEWGGRGGTGTVTGLR